MRRIGPWAVAAACLASGAWSAAMFVAVVGEILAEWSLFAPRSGWPLLTGLCFGVLGVVALCVWEGRVRHQPHRSSWVAVPGLVLSLVGLLALPFVGLAILARMD
jgi:hypothetical protein